MQSVVVIVISVPSLASCGNEYHTEPSEGQFVNKKSSSNSIKNKFILLMNVALALVLFVEHCTGEFEL